MRFKTFLIALMVMLASAASLHAAAINYGNFLAPPGVTFIGVTESSGTDPVPMYNAPTTFVTGLDFNPTSFVATASGGAIDVTDGQLNFTISTTGTGLGIDGFSINERGDYTLVGSGTPLSSVFAGAIIQASIIEVDGVPVAPIALPASNNSVGFNLIANPGIVQPWALAVGDTVTGLPPGSHATKIEIAINNALDAISEQSSLAFIAKKDFIFNVAATPFPEPASLAFAVLVAPLLMRKRRTII